MFYKNRIVLSWLALLLSFSSLFLSAWIIIPAPNMLLLNLGVGAPEISPWLLMFNLLSALLAFFCICQFQIQGGRREVSKLSQIFRFLGLDSYFCRTILAAIFSLTGLLFCSLVLVNITTTQMQMAQAMKQGLGADYLEKIPMEISTKMQPSPFSLVNTIRGISLGKTIHKTGIIFATPAEVSLKMEVYQPLKKGKHPALVVIYGGAWQRGNPHANSEFNQYIASRGYTVFSIDYRHAPKYKFPAQLEDVNTALNFIRQHAAEYAADSERIVLLGRSAGAHLAMLAAYQPDAPPILAVVSYYGPVDLTEGYKSPPQPDPIDTRAVLRTFIGGSLAEFPQQYEIASPINYVKSSLPPTLLIYGGRDHLVEAKFGRQMYERLQNFGNTAIFLEIPWAEHAFDAVFNGVSNQLALYYTERFLAWAFFGQ